MLLEVTEVSIVDAVTRTRLYKEVQHSSGNFSTSHNVVPSAYTPIRLSWTETTIVFKDKVKVCHSFHPLPLGGAVPRSSSRGRQVAVERFHTKEHTVRTNY